ncbi:MAG: hypothetical protein ACI86M_002366 [Saprospiraceae bacterium]|jgi:hypothetical protein
MDRRDSLKTLLIGGIGATGLTIGAVSCKEDGQAQILEAETAEGVYGRTAAEQKHDEKIKIQGQFFSEADLLLVAVLCDLILPATNNAGSATDAEVPAFIDFIVKDLPYHQIPIQGGLMWLNGESNKRFNKIFESCSAAQHKQILDDIAYPSTDATAQYDAGRKFFERFRNLVLTGYYTTKMGIDDVGYVGNRANLWDGVPDDVLAKHGLSYDASMKGKYVNHDTRNTQAEWDENGDLIT